jgi:hypothetical protein
MTPKPKPMTIDELSVILFQKLDNRENDYFNALTDLKSDIKELKNETKLIKEQTTKTNGRVTLLEHNEKNCPIKVIAEETAVIRVLFKYPKTFLFMLGIILVILGFQTVLQLIG